MLTRVPLVHRFTHGAVGVVLLVAGTAGCGAAGAYSASINERGETRRAIVISAEHLRDRAGDLLGILASRVSSMSIARGARCPQISIRGRKTLSGISDPGIYVDGQRAGDTCILTMLSPVDLARVEVYPMGLTSRNGYHMDGAGLILIFTRRAGH
jgi:hypothetical protein